MVTGTKWDKGCYVSGEALSDCVGTFYYTQISPSSEGLLLSSLTPPPTNREIVEQINAGIRVFHHCEPTPPTSSVMVDLSLGGAFVGVLSLTVSIRVVADRGRPRFDYSSSLPAGLSGSASMSTTCSPNSSPGPPPLLTKSATM